MIYKSVEQLIGKTPLLEIVNVENSQNLLAKVMVKLERFNPAGSVKDRAALYMINDAEENGLIKKGATIIEPTSGNTGIGIAMICAVRGYKCILTMPDTMSVERRKLLGAYGAKIVLTDGALGMKGAIEKAQEINKKTPNSIILGQFENSANIKAHYKTTGPEIWQDTDGKVDVFIAGVGTGGTLSGTGKFLKEKNGAVKIVAVEPSNSPLISKGYSGAHGLQGIGANFIPENFDASVCDEVYAVSEQDAFFASRLLAEQEGLLVGISSGASLFVGLTLAKKPEYKDKNIVVLLPDTGERYLSSQLFE